jgi:tRNA and rRNA cytosine-C5-methylases
MVYSTCTFAPEENEAVLTSFLTDYDSAVRVLPLACAPPGASPGLEAFESQRFHPSLRDACRLWPHRTGTGGFFAVTLEKTGSGARASFGPSALPPATEDPRLPALFERFGLGDAAAGPWHYFDSPRNVRMVAADHEAPRGPRYLTHGLDLARNRAKVAKLSTPAAMALGPLATASVLELSDATFLAYRQREDALLPTEAVPPELTPGAVLVHFQGTFQGIALLHQSADGWRLESQYPKAWLRDKT